MFHADALSRLPIPETESECDQPEEVVFLMDHFDSTPITSAEIRRETAIHPVLSKVKQYTLTYWPNKMPAKF